MVNMVAVQELGSNLKCSLAKCSSHYWQKASCWHQKQVFDSPCFTTASVISLNYIPDDRSSNACIQDWLSKLLKVIKP